MTVQAADYMHIEKKKYTLIDIEDGKQIIDCAVFEMPKHDGNIELSTACRRGYTADYHILGETLYGIKKHEIFIKPHVYKVIESPKTMIPYTGSCIIAYGRGRNSDFIHSYIDYDEAFELYFKHGVLIETRTLISAIEKARAFQETYEYKNKMEPREISNLREKFAREPLKYRYDERRTYKWRYHD